MYNLRENSFTLKELTKALNTKAGKSIKYQIDVGVAEPVAVDHIGIFRQVYRPKVGPTKKRPSNIFAFYFVEKKGSNPPLYDDPWYNHIVDYIELTNAALNYKKRNTDDIDLFSLVQNKKQKVASPALIQDSIIVEEREEILPLSISTPAQYWQSTEAKKLFAPIEVETNAHNAVCNQISLLSEALESHDGYLKV